MPAFHDAIDTIGLIIDGAGVAVIALGIAIASARYLRALLRGESGTYVTYRHDLGRAILLGLELLVAGDIIRTVAVTPTLESVAVLGLIVIIRTMLSMSLQVELEGRWPWQAHERKGEPLYPPAPIATGPGR